MANNNVANISIENAKLRFRNFAGKASKFNAEGRRNFCVLIPDHMVQALIDEGWNIKFLKPNDDYDETQAYLQVKVSYGNISPRIYIVTERGHKTLLDEDTVGSLDYAEIKNVDVIIRPYTYSVNGKEGISAYVKNMYVTVYEDEFADKYADCEEETPFE